VRADEGSKSLGLNFAESREFVVVIFCPVCPSLEFDSAGREHKKGIFQEVAFSRK